MPSSAGATCNRSTLIWPPAISVKRVIVILLLGAGLSLGGYLGSYLAKTAPRRAVLSSEAPELEWLKIEFKLGDEEFARISRLHEAYLPQCAQRCAAIDAKHQEMTRLLAGADTVTPEIEKAIADAARLRAECQTAMLKHFCEVSRAMPPAQGKRYLDWVKERTFLPDYDMSARH